MKADMPVACLGLLFDYHPGHHECKHLGYEDGSVIQRMRTGLHNVPGVKFSKGNSQIKCVWSCGNKVKHVVSRAVWPTCPPGAIRGLERVGP